MNEETIETQQVYISNNIFIEEVIFFFTWY